MSSYKCVSVVFFTLSTATLCIDFPSSVSGQVQLFFGSGIPGTLSDKDGLGTGFTHRLPNTGASFGVDDPNLDLSSEQGFLLIHSTRADINQANLTRNLSTLEAPGVRLDGVDGKDIYVSALFVNVNVPNLSDQLALYAGVSSEQVLRTSLHQGNSYIFTENYGIGDDNTLTGANAFSSGDNIELRLARVSGEWQMSWENLTHPSQSGSLPAKQLPWLDGEETLYVGILASNARSNVSFLGRVEHFSVAVVPEPAIMSLVSIAALPLLMKRGQAGLR